MDIDGIASAVKTEIERQQMHVDYDSMSVDALETIVGQLKARLQLCNAAIAAKGLSTASTMNNAAEVPKPTAQASGTDKLRGPFTKADGTQDADKIKAYMVEEMSRRIMVLDGAMGTAIQAYKFSEEDFRMDKFKDHHVEIKGNNDLLVFTQV